MRPDTKDLLWAIAGLLGSIACFGLLLTGMYELFRGRVTDATLSFVLVILFRTAGERTRG